MEKDTRIVLGGCGVTAEGVRPAWPRFLQGRRHTTALNSSVSTLFLGHQLIFACLCCWWPPPVTKQMHLVLAPLAGLRR